MLLESGAMKDGKLMTDFKGTQLYSKSSQTDN